MTEFPLLGQISVRVKVVVPHFWGLLKVTVLRVKVMVIIIMVKVRGQVFC